MSRALQQSNGDEKKELQIRDELNEAAAGSHTRIKLAKAAAEEEQLDAHKEAISQSVSAHKDLGMDELDMDAKINIFIEKISTEESVNHTTIVAAQRKLYESYKTTLLEYYEVVKDCDFEPVSLNVPADSVSPNAPAEGCAATEHAKRYHLFTNSLSDRLRRQEEEDKAYAEYFSI